MKIIKSTMGIEHHFNTDIKIGKIWKIKDLKYSYYNRWLNPCLRFYGHTPQEFIVTEIGDRHSFFTFPLCKETEFVKLQKSYEINEENFRMRGFVKLFGDYGESFDEFGNLAQLKDCNGVYLDVIDSRLPQVDGERFLEYLKPQVLKGYMKIYPKLANVDDSFGARFFKSGQYE